MYTDLERDMIAECSAMTKESELTDVSIPELDRMVTSEATIARD